MTTGLTYSEPGHRYRLDGKHVPSVTGIIGKGLPKPALMYWSAKTVAEWVVANAPLADRLTEMGGEGPAVAYLKAIPWAKRDAAAVRGTAVHALAERLVHGEEVEVPEHLAAYVDGYVTWLDLFAPAPILTERPVLNRQWHYAGTFDLIANLMGQVWLLDVKTSANVYGDNAIQLAAYAGAEAYVDADGGEQPMPHIDRLGILHVQPGLTTLHPVRDGGRDDAWRDWLHIQWVANATDRIKNYMTEPIEAMPDVP